MQQDISVWVRDPRIQNTDFWHAYIDYEICLLTNSLCFTRRSRVRGRRFSEFCMAEAETPSALTAHDKATRDASEEPILQSEQCPARSLSGWRGLQRFLEQVLQSPLLLSDSCVHLFLQSPLSMAKMEACAAGRTRFSVAQAI
ncbi:hypothetical protein CRUP_004413, partial [Coryphaenoides rupestris]